jgi:radical SAM superfamily enzyme YgiQ (UPF0313 family)
MARVLLAKARFKGAAHDNNIVPPLGAMYIAAVLREAGHDVRIFEQGTDGDLERFRRSLRDYRPQVVGLSAITIEGRSMERLAAAARETLPEVPIIVGGPHATAYPERCARHPAVDYVVLGEGEQTAVELVGALTSGGRDPATIEGLCFRDASGELVHTGERAAIEDVDSLPFPAWDLIDVDYYARYNSFSDSGRRRHMLLFTSRGCPFKCIYCHEVQGKRFRSRSPANVLEEMEALRSRYGINDFEIIDDIFNFDRERMIDILDRVRMLRPLPALHFPNALRTDILDEKQITALRRSGTQSLCVAVETTSLRLQKLVKKHLKVERVRQNIDIAVRQGMLVRGFFMLGFPTETLAEARATVDFALQSNLHQALFFIVTPFAGTALYEIYEEMLRQKGVHQVPFEDRAYMTGTYNLSEIPDEVLFNLQQEAFRRFYLNPTRMARMVVRHPKPVELVRYAQPLLRLLSPEERVERPEAEQQRPAPTHVHMPTPAMSRRGGLSLPLAAVE